MKRLLALLALGLMLGGCGGVADEDDDNALLDGILAAPDETDEDATTDENTDETGEDDEAGEDGTEPFSEGPDAPPSSS